MAIQSELGSSDHILGLIGLLVHVLVHTDRMELPAQEHPMTDIQKCMDKVAAEGLLVVMAVGVGILRPIDPRVQSRDYL